MSIASRIGRMLGGPATAASPTKSRSVAKDRLSVILATQRGSELLQNVDMELLKNDVMEVFEVSLGSLVFVLEEQQRTSEVRLLLTLPPFLPDLRKHAVGWSIGTSREVVCLVQTERKSYSSDLTVVLVITATVFSLFDPRNTFVSSKMGPSR